MRSVLFVKIIVMVQSSSSSPKTECERAKILATNVTIVTMTNFIVRIGNVNRTNIWNSLRFVARQSSSSSSTIECEQAPILSTNVAKVTRTNFIVRIANVHRRNARNSLRFVPRRSSPPHQIAIRRIFVEWSPRFTRLSIALL